MKLDMNSLHWNISVTRSGPPIEFTNGAERLTFSGADGARKFARLLEVAANQYDVLTDKES